MRKFDLDDLSRKCGGRFKLSVLLQKRVRELVRGVPPLLDTESHDPIEIALEELTKGLIAFDPAAAAAEGSN